MSNQTQPTHTPGPWRTMSWGETISIDAKVEGEWHLGLAHINPHGNHNAGIASAQDRANARLIAAAPDLLAALENVLETLTWAKQEKGAAYQYAAEDLTAVTSKLSQALAKAKG